MFQNPAVLFKCNENSVRLASPVQLAIMGYTSNFLFLLSSPEAVETFTQTRTSVTSTYPSLDLDGLHKFPRTERFT